MAITQQEYEHLMSLEKVFDDLGEPLVLGPPPIQWTRFLTANEAKEKFILDCYRGGFELAKYTFNKRYRQTVVLLRYDNCGRHTNPDGVTFDGPHVHLYREGYDDKFAFPIADVGVKASDSRGEVLIKIFSYCNVTSFPVIEVGLY